MILIMDGIKLHKNAIDLTQQRFGNLIALYPVGRDKWQQVLWHCKCDCGKEVDISCARLRNGNTKSCGCRIGMKQYNLKDEIGHQYGRLTVIERAGRDKYGNALWKCKCECGNETIVAGISLRYGNTTSCGCLKSKGETKIANILSEHQVDFQREFYFEDLYVDIKPALFDFAIFINNKLHCLIEYQGIQHYNLSEFGRLQREVSDPLKKEYCKQHQIHLVEISYLDFGKINWDYLKEKCNL